MHVCFLSCFFAPSVRNIKKALVFYYFFFGEGAEAHIALKDLKSDYLWYMMTMIIMRYEVREGKAK